MTTSYDYGIFSTWTSILTQYPQYQSI